MISVFIFDHDGVMIDTEPLQHKAWVHVLKEYGITPVYHKNGLVHTIGISIPENWERLKEQYNLDEEISILEGKRGKIYNLLLKTAPPMKGLIELIKRIEIDKESKHLKLAIASSSNKEYIDTVIKGMDLQDVFDLIVTRSDVKRGKPHPDIYLKVAEMLNVKPQECVVFEDSQTGVEAGYLAGMKVIAIPNSYTIDQDFSKAVRRYKSLDEIQLKDVYGL